MCATARTGAARLEPVPDDPPTVLEKDLLEAADEQGAGVLLLAPATGVRALPSLPDGSAWSYALQRLPSHSPLAEVTLSRDVCWIRTEDESLCLAPERSGYGINHGYSGASSGTLARLLDTLLDDIPSPAADAGGPDAPGGLLDLVASAPTHMSVTYGRARLLAARNSDGIPRRQEGWVSPLTEATPPGA
ncbi:hypothetical protein [Streptomyces sp. NPDC005828]|uniref:hypothetical protein n=1 Tax=Streptomyces sp. NPDC005828 TaxID=3157071 RepID=UPI0033ED71D8